ncbi:MAG TPA: protein kinase, partial [Planctomycetota bacterium]|nr:protein kinase [Planctomycetota bacterium]
MAGDALEIPGYRLEARLGAGGAGTVFRATQLSMERAVALKILSPKLSDSPEYVERFIREARAAARLNHPNVVRTFDAGTAGGRHYYAMEFVAGTSLRKRLEAGPMPAAEALSVVTDVARALD